MNKITNQASTKPTAYITKNKQRIKQFNRSVYLKNKDNFEIELFNPLTTHVLATIKIDGKLISSSGIVIRPGERIFLERYLDTNNKFEFGTYEVSATNNQVQEAIQHNGNVEVAFYDEQITLVTTYPSTYTYSTYGGTGTNINYTNTFDTSTSNISFTTPTADVLAWDVDDMSVSGTATFGDLSNSRSVTPANKKETGVVDKGESSEQSFVSSDRNFNHFSFHTETWKILPVSQKQITSSDIKVYCTSCGSKIKKSTYKFCPNCGTSIK